MAQVHASAGRLVPPRRESEGQILRQLQGLASGRRSEVISKTAASKQLQRLINFQGFPVEDVCQKDLIKAIRASDNEAMAEAVLDEWIKENKFAPRPADIYQLVRERRARLGLTEADLPPCVPCSGTGYTIVEGRHPLDHSMRVSAALTCGSCNGTGNAKAAPTISSTQKRRPDAGRPSSSSYPD